MDNTDIRINFSGEECLGSARIERVGPTHYTMNVNNCREEIKKQRIEGRSKRTPNGNSVTSMEDSDNV